MVLRPLTTLGHLSDGLAGGDHPIELNLQVLEVEGEIQNVDIRDVRFSGARLNKERPTPNAPPRRQRSAAGG